MNERKAKNSREINCELGTFVATKSGLNLHGPFISRRNRLKLERDIYPERSKGREWLYEKVKDERIKEYFGSSDDDRLHWVPNSIKNFVIKSCHSLAKSIELNRSSEFSAMRMAMALNWEIVCLKRAYDDGELISDEASLIRSKVTDFMKYLDGDSLSGPPSTSGETLTIQNDAPIMRLSLSGELLPYVVECKQAITHPYGQSYGSNPEVLDKYVDLGNVNQALRYQEAINNGLISGATIEINGRVDPKMVDWVLNGYQGESLIPDVEVIWHCPLVSGGLFPVLIKEGIIPGRIPFGDGWKVEMDNDDILCVEGFNYISSDIEKLKDVCFMSVDESLIEDKDVSDMLTQPTSMISGRETTAIERSWTIKTEDVHVAFEKESKRQAASKLHEYGVSNRLRAMPRPNMKRR